MSGLILWALTPEMVIFSSAALRPEKGSKRARIAKADRLEIFRFFICLSLNFGCYPECVVKKRKMDLHLNMWVERGGYINK